MFDVAELRRRLLETVGADGGWAYYSGKAGRIEPTAWALMALGATGHDGPVRERAVGFLARLAREGGLLVDPGSTHANAAWNGLALVALNRLDDGRAVDLAGEVRKALTGMKGIALRPDATVRQDNGLQAWPWVHGTFSWVEPTAYCTLALKQHRSAEAADRIAEAERLLIDRACQPAGWNYGNSAVLDQELRPYVPTTALALLALQDLRAEPAVQAGLDWLGRHAVSERSAMALGLAATALTVFDRPADRSLGALGEALLHTGFLGNSHLLAVALFALTLRVHGGQALRIQS